MKSIFILYICVQAVEHLVTFLNLHHLAVHGAKVPRGFGKYISSDVLTGMRDYTLARERVSLVASLMDAVVTILFIFGGILIWYTNWFSSLQWSFVIASTLFFLFIFYIETLFKIPFSLYSTFRVEQKYGFNRQTSGLWCMDLIKSLFLGTVLYAVLLSGAFWIIMTFPGYWWLITWLFFLSFSVILMYLAPYVIEPLFNTFTPIEDKSLEEKIRHLMDKAGISITRVFTMDASKRSSHGNASFSGIGHFKRIVLFDTLLKTNSHDEILAILAHEAGHWKKKHIFKRLAVMEGLALAGIYIAFLLVQGDMLAEMFGLMDPPLYAKLLLAGFLGGLLASFVRPFHNWYSRKHEWEADAFAADLTGDPTAMARALIKLGRDNLSNLHPHPWYAALHYSHPPLAQRVRRLLQ